MIMGMGVFVVTLHCEFFCLIDAFLFTMSLLLVQSGNHIVNNVAHLSITVVTFNKPGQTNPGLFGRG